MFLYSRIEIEAKAFGTVRILSAVFESALHRVASHLIAVYSTVHTLRSAVREIRGVCVYSVLV
jgi:hypothetical protein